MLRSLPELMIMIKGMVSAAASVGYTLGLLMLITYVFAIALVNLVPPDSEIEGRYFSNVPLSIHHLIIFGTFTDSLAGFILDIEAESLPCLLMCWLYVALASLTVMNMLIGVLCEVISSVAEEEKESMMVDMVNDKFQVIAAELDEDGNGELSYEEFQKILEFPEALKALESVNVDGEALVDMSEDFFFDDGVEHPVSFGDFMSLVLDLRGGQQATVKDAMRLQKRMNQKFSTMGGRMDMIEESMGSIHEKLDKLQKRKDKQLSPESNEK